MQGSQGGDESVHVRGGEEDLCAAGEASGEEAHSLRLGGEHERLDFAHALVTRICGDSILGSHKGWRWRYDVQ